MDRRDFLKVCSAVGVNNLLASSARSDENREPIVLRAAPGETYLVGPNAPSTSVWTFNGQVPGTPIRITQGDPLAITLSNELEVPTAVHWHGIRLPNAMDGVAGLTQAAVKPGDEFEYKFTPPDAGTYWYHSHVNAYEQIGRGLYGPLIIEERNPPKVDRDLIWMIDDWRLLKDASISDDFGAGHDRSHAGRIGNIPTINGRFRDVVPVRSGERIRLRLINAANARNFALSFTDLSPEVIAIDGQAVTPYQAKEPIVIGAAGRVDVILDCTGKPGTRSSVVESFYRDSYDLTSFVYESGESLRQSPPDWSTVLAAPSLPEPDLKNAITQRIVIEGGAMGGLRRAKLDGQWMDLRTIAQQGYVWALNETVAHTLKMPPLIDVVRGTSVKLQIENKTAFPHPMHLHGHHMKLLSIDDQAIADTRWVDSPLLMPRQKIELAFVADNPGNWLFHCHVLEHHAAGLGALVRVS